MRQLPDSRLQKKPVTRPRVSSGNPKVIKRSAVRSQATRLGRNLSRARGRYIIRLDADDYFDENKTNYYDNNGNKQGSTKQDYFNSDKTNIYDDNGNLIGYRQNDYFDKDKINVYNSRGTKVGYYKKNYFNGNWEYFDN